MTDHERVSRMQNALLVAQADALVCALPAHVLMSTGYWPVVGASIAVTTREGRCLVLAPEDEAELARRGWAEVRTYYPSSLEEIRSVAEAVIAPLRALFGEVGAAPLRVLYEHGPASEPASYAAMHLFGASMPDLLREVLPGATLVAADELLARQAAVKTAAEVEHLRLACRIAGEAFVRGASWLGAGMQEIEAAAMFQAPLGHGPGGGGETARSGAFGRADGFAFCMSGPNSAEAGAAYARSRQKRLAPGELVLVHCNSYVDGYWTDITRTYSLGDPQDRAHRMYQAVLSARGEALSSIRPGVRAADVDQSARQEIAVRGFAGKFPHAAGHGVGFGAISADARPRIHPKSEELLEPGMVFNLEPAIYVAGFGGVRHCEVVTVTDHGVEVLTPFHSGLDDLVIRDERAQRIAPSQAA